MQLPYILISALAASVVKAATNEPCIGKDGHPGVCVDAADCEDNSGTTVEGRCPSDPAGVLCCTKPDCDGSSSRCLWDSDCPTSSVSNKCPGPASMKCCKSDDLGYGGFDDPSFSTTSCDSVAIKGAEVAVEAFPGRVREIFCIRDCACGSGSDHCCGKAVDLMCSDAGGTPTTSGQEIAEWVMENASDQDVKYIIWGQKIWETGSDATSWINWTPMEDRGDVTQNHWDHVHISYN